MMHIRTIKLFPMKNLKEEKLHHLSDMDLYQASHFVRHFEIYKNNLQIHHTNKFCDPFILKKEANNKRRIIHGTFSLIAILLIKTRNK